ncbi:hypothetical protein HETIRDRAFT_470846 [Heterobasidion irregulare TC 32-1]|uniref:Geranylgeranyl transferase type-2 subunit alpha n=1 Tax=Heterobasidion irregulare (strain TC 32-1) TaxID=747525 RepID=W4KJ13_HETIT|nr:uncharacterized protein HETIRDRAFT_470846 [Heterobasidion irregulare TC 32-1]ETW85709.1 hypothetical protein HETIRDRAFT_470846 [Heterobasidion irregulare TC 32-1]
MHGVRRVRESLKVQEEKKQKEKAKLAAYLALTDKVLSKKKSNDWSGEAFELTSRLLNINPEFYTIWNYRRNILTRGIFPSSSPAEINGILSNDLDMTTTALKAHPKVYWIWNHRRWCLENIPDGGDNNDEHGWRKASWERELFIVEKMLDADARNFLAWGYRRYVLASMPVRRPEIVELASTTRKIEANFSNFSAWHQRTKVLASLWDSGKLDKHSSLQQEFDLVQNAMYTDPNDQSVWLYHRWLIGTGRLVPCCPSHHTRASFDTLIVNVSTCVWFLRHHYTMASLGCMDTLVYYKQLLLRKHPTHIGSLEAKALVQQCIDLLQQLESVDPSRRQRYRALGQFHLLLSTSDPALTNDYQPPS